MKKLIVGTTNDYFPYSYKNGNGFIGYDIEMCEILGKYLGIKMEYQGYENVSDIILAIKKKEVDLIASGLSIISKHLEQGISFVPYGNCPYYSLLVNNEHKYLENWSELDNSNMVVAAAHDTIAEKIAKEMFKDASINKYEQIPLREALIRKKVDAIIINENWAKTNHIKNADDFIILEPNFKQVSNLGIGYARNNHDLMDKLWKFALRYANSQEQTTNNKKWLINA